MTKESEENNEQGKEREGERKRKMESICYSFLS